MPWSSVNGSSEPTATGGVFGTVTRNACETDAPSGSRAVTVTRLSPRDPPVTDTSLPLTFTVAAASFDDDASYRSVSPSGSRKCGDASTTTVPPRATVSAGIAPATLGGSFAPSTVTTNSWSVRPPCPSSAVTVTFATPFRMPSNLARFPAMPTATTSPSEETAVYVSVSPSRSPKYPGTATLAVSPRSIVRSGIVPSRSGARLGTVATNSSDTDPPRPSSAVTVTGEAPRSTPVTVSRSSRTRTVATDSFKETAPYPRSSPSGS